METPAQLIELLYTAQQQGWHPQAIADIEAQLEAATGGTPSQLSQTQQPAPARRPRKVDRRRGDRHRNRACRPAAAQQPVEEPAAPEWANHTNAWDAPAPAGQPGIEGERRQAASRLQARLAQLPELPSLDAFDVPAEAAEDLRLHEAEATAGPSRHAAEADAEHKAWQKLHPQLTAALVGSQAVPAEAQCCCCCRQRPACLECQSCGHLGDPRRQSREAPAAPEERMGVPAAAGMGGVSSGLGGHTIWQGSAPGGLPPGAAGQSREAPAAPEERRGVPAAAGRAGHGRGVYASESACS